MDKEEKTPAPKIKSSRKQKKKRLIPWIGLTLFACAWMFVLGIFVGREMVPVRFDIEKLQKELGALKETVIKKELDQYKIDSNADVTKTKMKFYESLKKTDRIDNLKNTEVKPQKKTLPEKVVSLPPSKVPSQKQKSGLRKASQDNPLAGAGSLAGQAKRGDQRNEGAGQSFTIQVASTRDSGEADKLVNKLKKQGYPAYRSIGNISGKGTWYRVRMGYFKNKTEAGLMLRRLKEEKINAIIVLQNSESIPQKKTLPEKVVSLQKTKTSGQSMDSAQKEKKSGFKKASRDNPPAVAGSPDGQAKRGDQVNDGAGKNFTVQVASMRDSGEADKLVNKLKKQGYPAYRSIGKIPGKGIWYRVRVGYYRSKTEAGPTLKRLKKGKIDAVIVQR
ncbi:MAG: SPOR domain-containing protein [Desulfobacterales bacterium]